jgi:LysM repeat protein
VPGRAPAAGQLAAAKPVPANPPAPQPDAGQASTKGRQSATYTVKAGDTLYGIARQFGKAVPDLLSLNNLSARAVIQPGLRLRVQ